MNVSEIKECLKLGYKAKVPMMIWGHHGMGKSSAVAQLAKEEGRGFVDFRCAQIEASDLRGWPSREGGVTIYNPPDELPREGEGYLFLDELNRADDPVIQAVFQLIVERRIGQYVLPEGWMVVSAGNYTKGYHVNDFCSAFIGRFCHLQLTKSEDYIGGWAAYMMQKHAEAAGKIVQFIGTDLNDICSRESESLDFKIEPSPRLWEMLARVEEVKTGFEPEIVSACRRGLLGADLAIKYERVNFSIDPRDVVHKGMSALDGHQISRDHMAGLVWGVTAYVKAAFLKEGKGTKWTIKEKEADNVLDFMEHLTESKQEQDMALVLIMQILKPEMKNAGSVVVSNLNVTKILAGSGSIWLRKLSERQKLFELTKRVRDE